MTITFKANPDGVTGAIQVNGNDTVVIGSQGITQGAPFSFRNKIINGAFAINQRAYVSGATTAAGHKYASIQAEIDAAVTPDEIKAALGV